MIRAALLAFALAAPVAAETEPETIARRAAEALDQAAEALEAADGARDRVQALTETIRAFEQGLSGLRAGLRAVVGREQVIRATFDAESARLAQLLAVLQSIEAAPTPLLLLHPQGPLGTARSGMMVADVAPALEAEVRVLRAQLEEIAALRSIQDEAAAHLEAGLRGAQDARSALNQAIAERTDLPLRFAADEAALRRLLDGAETLAAFARGLNGIVTDGTLPALPDFDRVKGQLALPVTGTRLRRFNETDAAGIRRPGMILATRPRALVTAPWPATLRYRGPLLDYGNVVILEPGANHLMIFAGLGEVYGEIGEILPAGAPVGLMGGDLPDVQAILSEAADRSGITLSETLYIEIREGGEPVDPDAWFTQDKD